MRPPLQLRAKMKILQQKLKKERKTHIKIEEKCDEVNLHLNSQIAKLQDHLKVLKLHLKKKDDQITDQEDLLADVLEQACARV